jgi:peptidyl-prolyl cis-trans isomerase SurA
MIFAMQPRRKERHRIEQKQSARAPCAAVILFLAVPLMLLSAPIGPAAAQQVAVIVNGEPITTYDIEQRARFFTLTSHKPAVRQEVVDDLINDKLKVQVAKKYKLDITEKDVDTAFGNMGKRMGANAEKLTQLLAQNGVDASTLKSRIRSEIAWTQIVRGKFANYLQIGDKEIRDAQLAQPSAPPKDPTKPEADNRGIIQSSVDNKADDAELKSVEYTMRPILFIVPRGTSEEGIAERKRDAEALRARFSSCAADLEPARALRYVAVRDPIVKSSTDLVPELRKILETTPVGHLTPPDVTEQGVQVFAICSKKETNGDTPEQRAIREKLFGQRYEEQSKKFLAELRREAMIEVK